MILSIPLSPCKYIFFGTSPYIHPSIFEVQTLLNDYSLGYTRDYVRKCFQSWDENSKINVLTDFRNFLFKNGAIYRKILLNTFRLECPEEFDKNFIMRKIDFLKLLIKIVYNFQPDHFWHAYL